jgi:Nif-specific regulatory protein
MKPRLVARDGPLKGTEFPLSEEEFSIGRDASNRLRIADLSISREHCLIDGQGGQFLLRDLESRNGTFVNGTPIGERRLEHGDEIRIGDSLFLFLLRDDEVAAQPVLRLDDRDLSGATVVLRGEDALYLHPEKFGELAAGSQVARNLQALLKISTVVNSIRKLDALGRKLLENIIEAVPAQRGAVLLIGDGAEEFTSVFVLNRRLGTVQPFPVSSTVIRKVMQEKAGVLSNDILEDHTFNEAKSLIDSQTRSLLAVPMLVFDKILGLIYLDSSDPAARLDSNHLQLLTAIAAISAVAFDNARHVEWLEGENQRLQEEIGIECNMVGESPAIRAIHERIAKVAPTDSTVLITGESGTGKELVARAIHANSPRAAQPFVAINCAALSEALLESELFGHERGAFTGAIAQKKGKLEVAHGGTVFLDEIAELSPVLQPKLLRVLQERELERVGGTRPIKVNIRLIAATNKDLEEAVREKKFRQDLFYRLNVIALRIPPLRERREDIPLLTSYFAAKYGEKLNRRVRGVSPKARAHLVCYDWPGNVRELENAIERAVVLGSAAVILPEDLPEAVLETEAPPGGGIPKYHEAVMEAKKQLIRNALEQAHGSHVEAAKLIGVHPNYLSRLIRNLHLKTAIRGAGQLTAPPRGEA